MRNTRTSGSTTWSMEAAPGSGTEAASQARTIMTPRMTAAKIVLIPEDPQSASFLPSRDLARDRMKNGTTMPPVNCVGQFQVLDRIFSHYIGLLFLDLLHMVDVLETEIDS